MSRLLNAGRPSARQDAKSKFADLANLEEQRRVNFNISLEMHSKLKIYAAKKGLTITQVLTDFIESLPE
ncbi:plasmid partition protein ParG [Denitrificimonas caeni]|uniref:plasmid partition protein ParG n=1 Tax=Denitrificimonas caeni TaxID=521720 RepID=UPI0003B44AEA|nr:plasmid partition protein ParG [Denitrificimonas caeni]